MIINKLILRNFKRFENETIEFPEGVMGLIGENGAGKSSIIEGIIFALYGVKEIPTDYVPTRGSNKKAEVTLFFSIEGKEYEIFRTIKGKTHNATLYLNAEPVSEGVNAVQEQIGNLIGMSYTDFKNTIYAAQGDLKSILESSPTDRKRWFMKVIGIDNIREYVENQTKDKIKTLKQELTLLDGMLLGINKAESEEKIKEIQIELQKYEYEKNDKEFEIKNIDADLEILREYFEKTEFAKFQYEDKLKTRDNLKTELRLINTKIDANKQTIEASKKRYEEALACKDNYDKYIELSQAYAQVAGRQQELQKQSMAIKQELYSLEKMNTNFQYRDQEEINLQKEEIKNYKELIKSAPRCPTEIVDEYHHVKSRIKTLEVEVGDEEIPKNIEQIREEISEEVKKMKELVKKYDELKEKEKRFENFFNLNNYRETLKSLESQVKIEEEYIELTNKLSDYTKKEAELNIYEDRKKRYEEVQELIKEKQKTLKTLEEELTTIPEEPPELKELLSDFNKYAGRDTSLRAYEEATMQSEMLIQESEIIAEDMTTAIKDIESAPFDDNKLIEIKNNINNRELELVKLKQIMNNLESTISMYNNNLNQEKQVIQKYDDTYTKRADSVEQLQLYTDTRALINDFLEELLNIIKTSLIVEANSIIYSVTDGLYKGMDIDENFGIFVENENGLHPVAMLSGGEKDVVAVALRIATSKLIASLHNQQDPTVLFFDEIFGALDANRRDNLSSIMNLMKHKFPQIVLITHIDEQKEMLPHSLTVVRDNDTYSKIIVNS